MAAPEYRFASGHPALGLAAIAPGFDHAALLQAISKIYQPISREQESELRAIVHHYLFVLFEYELGVGRTDMARFAAEFGLKIDALLNQACGAVAKVIYERDAGRRSDPVARFTSGTVKLAYQGDYDAVEQDYSRTLITHLNALFLQVKESDAHPTLDLLRFSPEDLICQIGVLRGYLRVLVEVYQIGSHHKSGPVSIVADARSSTKEMIRHVHAWAARHKLPRYSRRGTDDPTRFMLLVQEITNSADVWLWDFMKTFSAVARTSSTADSQADARPRSHARRVLDLPQDHDSWAQMITAALAAGRRKNARKIRDE